MSNGALELSKAIEILSETQTRRLPDGYRLVPTIIIHRQFMDASSEELISHIARDIHGVLISYHPIWKTLASKWSAELCFRNGERSGIHVARPTTFLVEKANLKKLRAIGLIRQLILKPSHSYECNGILISTPATFDRVIQTAARSKYKQYVVQEVITDGVLLRGCRFDIRIYVIITSIRPPKFTILRNGVVKMAGTPVDPKMSGIRSALLTGSNYRRHNGHRITDISLASFFQTMSGNEVHKRRFWERVEQLIQNVVECYAIDPSVASAGDLDGRFLLVGVDILLQQTADEERILFLESNYAPSLVEWGLSIDRDLAFIHREWLRILYSLYKQPITGDAQVRFTHMPSFQSSEQCELVPH